MQERKTILYRTRKLGWKEEILKQVQIKSYLIRWQLSIAPAKRTTGMKIREKVVGKKEEPVTLLFRNQSVSQTQQKVLICVSSKLKILRNTKGKREKE